MKEGRFAPSLYPHLGPLGSNAIVRDALESFVCPGDFTPHIHVGDPGDKDVLTIIHVTLTMVGTWQAHRTV